MFFGEGKCNCKPIINEYPGIENPDDLYYCLRRCWSNETCAPRLRNKWSVKNMTLGQCSITAFLAQDIFGGKVYGIERPNGSFHCYNIVNEYVFDLTSEQFGNEKLDYFVGTEQFRNTEHHFGNGEKQTRYELLKNNLKTEIQRQHNGYYDDVNPIDKKDEILEILKEYNPVVHTNKEADYSWIYDDSVSIVVSDESGAEMLFIDLEGEFSYGFGGWHTHADPYRFDYERMLKNIKNILDNKLAAICIKCNGDWMGSSLANIDELDRENLINEAKGFLTDKEFREKMRLNGIVIECNFFDKSKNIYYEIAGYEI